MFYLQKRELSSYYKSSVITHKVKLPGEKDCDMSGGNTTRYFTDAFDYDRVLPVLDWDDRDQTRSFLAQIRLNTFLSERLVLTDVQLIHSRVFANLANIKDEADEHLINSMPLDRIEIRARTGSFQSSLLSLVTPNEGENLKMHWFPSVDPDGEIMKQIAYFRTSELNGWRSIPKILKTAGADKAGVDRLEQSWATFCDLEANGKLVVAPWPRQTEFQWSDVFERNIKETLDRVEYSIGGGVISENIFSELKNNIKNRAFVTSLISKHKNSVNINQTVATDLNTIETWYNHCYNKTIATQHECNFIELNYNYTCYPITDAEKIYDEIVHSTGKFPNININEHRTLANLSPSFMEAFSMLDQESIRRVLSTNKDYLEKWYKDGDLSALQVALERLVDMVDRERSFKIPSQSFIQRHPTTSRILIRSVTDSISSPMKVAAVLGGSHAAAYVFGELGFSQGASNMAGMAVTGFGALATNVAKNAYLSSVEKNISPEKKRSIVVHQLLDYAKVVRDE
jgi:hypothetical protein